MEDNVGTVDHAPGQSWWRGGAGPTPQRRLILLAASLLVIAGTLAYANALTNRFIGIDTLQAVRDNPDIRSLMPLSQALSLRRIGEAAAGDNSTLVRRPVLSLSFALNYAVLGPEAWGFQLVNVAIHIAAALLLFGIVRRGLAMLEYEDARRRLWLAFGIAVVWVVHPLTSESVTNIVQRAESLMAFFALLTVYCAVRAWTPSTLGAAGAGDGRAGSLGWSIASVSACAVGMATKEVMVVVPVLVWLFDAIFVSRGFIAPLRRRLSFYLALGSTWLVLVLLVALTLENTAREFDTARLGAYILSQPGVVMHYLRLAFWPHPLYHHILGESFWFHPGADAWSKVLPEALALLGLGAATAYAIIRRRPAGFLGAWFLLPLLPTSLVATFTLIQEHRIYLSLAAVVTATVLAVDALMARLAPRLSRAVLASLLVVVVGGLVYGTRLRNADYRSDLTLWAPADLPLAFTMLSNLAMYYQRLPEAEEVFETLHGASKQAQPGEPLFGYDAKALAGLGAVRALQGRLEEAERLLSEALEQDASYAVAESNLGVVLFARGRRAEAQRHLRNAMARDPSFNYVVVRRAEPELIPVVSWFGEEQRQGLAQADMSRLRFSVVLNPPKEEFSIDFRLGLNVTQDAPEAVEAAEPAP